MCGAGRKFGRPVYMDKKIVSQAMERKLFAVRIDVLSIRGQMFQIGERVSVIVFAPGLMFLFDMNVIHCFFREKLFLVDHILK